MKLTKKILFLVLSASVLSACNQGSKNLPVYGDNQNQIPASEVADKVVKKHETVQLPVNIYQNSDYDSFNSFRKKITFTRTITSVEVKEFDESTEIEFSEFYGHNRTQHIDLQKHYKLLVINMSHELKGDEKKPFEPFMLNAGSVLVIGEDEIALMDEFLNYQQQAIATDYKMGSTFDETGYIFLAIPNQFAENKNLQLKILQKLDDVKKYIYIDVSM